VAETLYALAGMVPDVDTLSESKINSQLPEVKSLDLPEPEASVIASGGLLVSSLFLCWSLP